MNRPPSQPSVLSERLAALQIVDDSIDYEVLGRLLVATAVGLAIAAGDDRRVLDVDVPVSLRLRRGGEGALPGGVCCVCWRDEAPWIWCQGKCCT